MPEKIPLGKQKNNPQNGRKHFQIVYLAWRFYLEYIKNTYNPRIKRQTSF